MNVIASINTLIQPINALEERPQIPRLHKKVSKSFMVLFPKKEQWRPSKPTLFVLD